MFQKSVAISLSPNTEPDDVLLALKLLVSPFRWMSGDGEKSVRSWFLKHYGHSNVCLFNSGRSALYALLKSFSVGEEDEVIIQAFTCVAVPEVVRWVKATPVYADIDPDSYNLTPASVTKRITKRTKAIIVQHTFGIPADIEGILAVAKRHNILVIEDCAHSLGATVNKKQIGGFGDAAFFSFGRDKIVSSVFGGAALVNPKHKTIHTRMERFYQTVPSPTFVWTVQQLLHPVLFSLILPLYHTLQVGKFSVGKALLYGFQRLKILSLPVYPIEKHSGKPDVFPATIPNALAVLAHNQLKKLARISPFL